MTKSIQLLLFLCAFFLVKLLCLQNWHNENCRDYMSKPRGYEPVQEIIYSDSDIRSCLVLSVDLLYMDMISELKSDKMSFDVTGQYLDLRITSVLKELYPIGKNGDTHRLVFCGFNMLDGGAIVFGYWSFYSGTTMLTRSPVWKIVLDKDGKNWTVSEVSF